MPSRPPSTKASHPASPTRRRLLAASGAALLLPPWAHGALPGSALPRLTARHAYVGNMNDTLVAYNADTPVQIASITKLVTAWVILSSQLPMNESIRIIREDELNTESTRSYLPIGSVWSREQLLEWLFITSDNRAAAALARSFPGGWKEFQWSMRYMMAQIHLSSFDFGDPSGLSPINKASARDLGLLILILSQDPWFQAMSRRGSHRGAPNTNRFSRNDSIQLMAGKTGFTSLAGFCLAQAEQIGDKTYALVVLNSASSDARVNDINLLRAYVQQRLTQG